MWYVIALVSIVLAGALVYFSDNPETSTLEFETAVANSTDSITFEKLRTIAMQEPEKFPEIFLGVFHA